MRRPSTSPHPANYRDRMRVTLLRAARAACEDVSQADQVAGAFLASALLQWSWRCPQRLVRCRQLEEEVPGVLSPLSHEFTRDEILSLIDSKARRVGWDSGFVLRHYSAGALDDFGKLAEAYALCDLLDRDDPAFLAV